MLVRWTKTATDDITHICDYTEKRFGVAQSRRVALGICDATDSLRDMPHRGRMGRKAGTRELTISGLPFVIIYRIRKETAEVVRILHGAQQWP